MAPANRGITQMTNEANAVATWANNVRETRANFQAEADALYDLWLSSDMEIVERDRRMAAIRASEAHCIEQEKKLYRLNLAGVA
jgi:hypothetical protein